MSQPNETLYYGTYLQVDRLLDLQKLESEKYAAPAHDEMLFIIVHQAYELWFKQILWELDAVLEYFDGTPVPERAVGRAVTHLERVTQIQRVLIDQLDVLETMTPLDFLEFRDYLVPASGFQSVQFRLIENRLGMQPDRRLKIEQTPYKARFAPHDRVRLEAAEQEPSLFDRVEEWLERIPFLEHGSFDFWPVYRAAVEAMLERERGFIMANPTLPPPKRDRELKSLDRASEQYEALFDETRYLLLQEKGVFRLSYRALKAALLINLYRDEPILHLPFRLLKALMDIDEGFTKWRYRHALMVLRMIGAKIGTGGSSGHDYLRRTAEEHKVFGDLFKLSTFFIPRSSLPALPLELRHAMDFAYGRSSSDTEA